MWIVTGYEVVAMGGKWSVCNLDLLTVSAIGDLMPVTPGFDDGLDDATSGSGGSWLGGLLVPGLRRR